MNPVQVCPPTYVNSGFLLCVCAGSYVAHLVLGLLHEPTTQYYIRRSE